MPRRPGALLLAVLLVFGVVGVAGPAAAAPADSRTAVVVQLAPGADVAAESRRAAGQGGSVSHVYRTALRGFAAELPDRAIAALRANPAVLSIEADTRVTVDATQRPAPWGLDRIDQRTRPLSGSYTYPRAGAGVTAYVIDTGIDPGPDFEDGLALGMTTVVDTNGTQDCNGHGSHVAGTIGGQIYGVAKEVTLVPVRVLDCTGSGPLSGVIAGLDWVAAHHQAGRPAVANLSLGTAASSSLDAAVSRVLADGVTVAVAAGNSGVNACSTSPARVAGALTVGATDRTDRRASFSNHGSCLDLFAPGVDITSDWLDGRTATISGTSMATPHVAGAAALLLQRNPGWSPATVAGRVVALATTGRVTSPGTGSPNRLLYSPPA